jgi:hypothetical protein
MYIYFTFGGPFKMYLIRSRKGGLRGKKWKHLEAADISFLSLGMVVTVVRIRHPYQT